MRFSMLSPVAALLIGAPLVAQTPHAPARVTRPVFIASLRGAMEVPPISTHAYGMARVTLVGSNLSYQVTVDDLRNVTGVFLHIGGPGQTTPVVADLFEGAKAGPVNGTLVSGTLRPRDVHGTTMSKLLHALRSDDAYLSVNTKAHPAGELRGELRLQSSPTAG